VRVSKKVKEALGDYPGLAEISYIYFKAATLNSKIINISKG
jgi:hypothetical protein